MARLSATEVRRWEERNGPEIEGNTVGCRGLTVRLPRKIGAIAPIEGA